MPDEDLNVVVDDVEPQAVDEPSPEPSVAPAPEPTPEPEPEPDIDTSWLNEIGINPPQQQQQQQPQYDQRQYQQPQYPQQHQQQPNPQSYGSDVDAYIEAKAQAVAQRMLEQSLGPVAMQLQQNQAVTSQHVRAVADTEFSRARYVAERALKEDLAKDKAYRENENVRNIVNSNLGQWLEGSYQQALQGNPRQLLMMHEPRFFRVLLAAAKELGGYQPNPAGPAQPKGAVVESATAPKSEKSVELPPDLEALAQTYGPAYRKQLEKAMQDSNNAGDFDMEV